MKNQKWLAACAMASVLGGCSAVGAKDDVSVDDLSVDDVSVDGDRAALAESDRGRCPGSGSGTARFARVLTSAGAGVHIADIATTPRGNIVVAGDFEGTVDFGTGALTSAGGSDLFIAAFGPCGETLWARRFGDAAAQTMKGLAISPLGDLLVTGEFSGTLAFGRVPITGPGVFAARLASDARTDVWTRAFTVEDAAVSVADVAIQVEGEDAVLIGWMDGGRVDFGNGAVLEGRTGGWVTRLDSRGNTRWATASPGGSDRADVKVVTGRGNVAYVWTAWATGSRVHLMKLAADGAIVYDRRYFGTGQQMEQAYDMGLAKDSTLFVTGAGAFATSPPTGDADERPFVANLDGRGNPMWIRRFDDRRALHLDVQPRALLIAGNTEGGDCLGRPGNDCGTFVARLTYGGADVWANGLPGAARSAGFAATAFGDPILAGQFDGSLDVGGIVLSGGAETPFLGSLSR